MSYIPRGSTHWIELESIFLQTEGATYSKAIDIYRNQNVLDIEIDGSEFGWFVYGRVQGTQRKPYEVSIDFSMDSLGRLRDWNGECTCPVTYQCKHAVAVLLKAAYKGYQILDRSGYQRPAPLTEEQLEERRKAESARLQELIRLEKERQLLEWLSIFERDGNPDVSISQDPVFQNATQKSPRKEHLLYLISILYKQGAKPELQLEIVTSALKVNGDWSKPKGIRNSTGLSASVLDSATDTDRDILQLFRAMQPSTFSYYSYSDRWIATPYGSYALELLSKAASTGRLYAAGLKGMPDKNIQWGPERIVQWTWKEAQIDKTGLNAWVLTATLSESSASLCINDPMIYFDYVAGVCGPAVAAGLSRKQVLTLLQAPPIEDSILQKYQSTIAAQLGRVPLPPVVQPMQVLTGLPLKAYLKISLNSRDLMVTMGLVHAKLQFDYGGHRGWWGGQGERVTIEKSSVGGSGSTAASILVREPDVERQYISKLLNLGLYGDSGGVFTKSGYQSQDLWLRWIDSDFMELRELGFEIVADDELKGWIARADSLDVSLTPQGQSEQDDGSLASTSPWFDLSLGMEINGKRQNILPWLPQILDIASRSPVDPETGHPEIPDFIFLSNPEGGFVRMPTAALKPWMAALLDLLNQNFSGDSLRLSRLDAMRTATALGEGVVWSGATELREMVQQLAGRDPIPNIPVPASLRATLRPYQQQGLNWLQFLRKHGLAGILADDMGLGKTLQTLAHIQTEKDEGRLDRPALIIAPVSLMGNWRSEAARFCPELRVVVVHGKDRHELASELGAQDIVIAPYSLLQRDKERWTGMAWHMVVLDEAQNIKNANTYAAQVVAELNTRYRLCLSGTPMENHLGEIWSLFYFLMPGFLGSQKKFQELFRNPIEKLGNSERMNQLRARITPFMLRRTKSLVAHELPPKVETIERVELEGKQADLYETIRLGMEKTVREALETKGLAKSQITILDALLKLRQVCCDPRLIKLPAAQKIKHSAKLQHLMELLPEMVAEGRRILLFSQFTSMLTLIEDELLKHSLQWVKLTGQSQNREMLIKQFTDGVVPIFLISLKAGGVGLNLPQADTVIHFDPWWNPAAENQATDRAHRIGQTQTVFVYKIVAQGTIEERILALQERKAALADSMYSGSVGRKQPLFTENDLAELLKPLDK